MPYLSKAFNIYKLHGEYLLKIETKDGRIFLLGAEPEEELAHALNHLLR